MIAMALMVSCSVITLVGIAALVRARGVRGGAAGRPPVTVLKPLCGADGGLRANLETFFQQDYPDHELVFGVAGDVDPAIAVVRELMARYPLVKARLAIHDGSMGLNPKVANLRAMLAGGSHDHVVVSDSNIAVGPGYLTSLVARLEPGVGLVTSLIAGTGEDGVGSALETLHLCGTIAPAVAASEALTGSSVAVGKSLLFKLSVLETLGGMESLASVLAEDYVMGRMFVEAGLRVVAAGEPVSNVTRGATVASFTRRQARWALLRFRLKPLAYPVEPLANPVAIAIAAVALGVAPAAAFAWAVGLALVRDAVAWGTLRGMAGFVAAAPLGLVKDAIVLGAWAAAPWKRKVSWRGNRLRISAGTRLYMRG